MQHKNKRILYMVLVLCLSLVIMSYSSYAADKPADPQRISGSDRYKTAAAISMKGWPSGSQYAVLARGDDFADALCAGPLAMKFNAPILLTPSDKINMDTMNELKRLGVKNILIVGGQGAVSEDIEAVLNNEGIDVERIWGNDRYETSIKIAEKIGLSDNIVLATGENFPDALSISAIAAKLGMPIILSSKSTLPEVVKQYINSRQIKKTYVIGGTGVIEDSVAKIMPGYIRLGGSDRFETNVIIMQEFSDQLNYDNVYIAVGEGTNGNEFADALSGAVLAALNSSPVVLTSKMVPEVIDSFIKNKLTESTVLLVLGGEGAVSNHVVNTFFSHVSQSTEEIIPPVVVPPGGGVPGGPIQNSSIDLGDVKIIVGGSTYTLTGSTNHRTIELPGSSKEKFTTVKISTTPADAKIVFTLITSTSMTTIENNDPQVFDCRENIYVKDILGPEIDKQGDGVSLSNLNLTMGDSMTIHGKISCAGYTDTDVKLTLKFTNN